MIDNARSNFKPEYRADLCIVGGGVAGITLATELRESFGNILVLESGEEHYHPDKQALYRADKVSSGFPDPTHSRLRMLGGSSNHWENNTSPLDAIDFERRAWVQNSGWPIKFDDVKPFYRKAAEYCGTGGDGYATDHWADDSRIDVLRGSALLQTSIAKASSPPTRFFYQHGEVLKQASTVSILQNATVVDADLNEAGDAIGCVYFESSPGKRARVRATCFVLCLGGIENARFLLALNDKYDNRIGNQFDNVGRYFMEHPTIRASHFFAADTAELAIYQNNRLPDRNVVGFMQLTDEALRENQLTNLRMPLHPANNYVLSEGISSFHVVKDALTDGEIPDAFGTHLVSLLSDLDMVIEAISRKSFDKRLFSHAQEPGGFQMVAMMEQTPSRNNRILLGQSKDAYGMRRVAIDWRVEQADKDRAWQCLELAAREIGARSLGRVRLLKQFDDRVWGSQLGFAHHHMGTTRMGESAEKAVVDRNGRIFGINNFYVAGSSVFTTGGHVPPTLTIVALTIRLARELEAKYASSE